MNQVARRSLALAAVLVAVALLVSITLSGSSHAHPQASGQRVIAAHQPATELSGLPLVVQPQRVLTSTLRRLPIGPPSAYIGVGDQAAVDRSGDPNMQLQKQWLNLEYAGTDKQYGDPFDTKWDPINGFNWPPGNSQTQPNYSTNGQNYGLYLPTGSSGYLQLYDPAYQAKLKSPFDATHPCGDGAYHNPPFTCSSSGPDFNRIASLWCTTNSVSTADNQPGAPVSGPHPSLQCSDQAQYNTTIYSLYYPDSTPDDYSDDVLADRWVVAASPVTGTLPGGAISPSFVYSDTWVNFNDAPGPGYLLQPYNSYTQWRLNASPIFTDTHNGGRGNVGQNQFAVRVRTNDSGVLAYYLDHYQGANTLVNSAGNVHQEYYLSNIPASDAGKYLTINLFDPGDFSGPNLITLLAPQPGGGTAPVTFHVITHGPNHNPAEFDTARLDTTRDSGGNNNFNDEWVDIVYRIPTDYSSYADYWKIGYDYGPGGGNDSTAWVASISDQPLTTPTPPATATATPVVPTNTATATPPNTATNPPTNTPTNTATNTNTPTATATSTNTPAPTATSVPPSATPTPTGPIRPPLGPPEPYMGVGDETARLRGIDMPMRIQYQWLSTHYVGTEKLYGDPFEVKWDPINGYNWPPGNSIIQPDYDTQGNNYGLYLPPGSSGYLQLYDPAYQPKLASPFDAAHPCGDGLPHSGACPNDGPDFNNINTNWCTSNIYSTGDNQSGAPPSGGSNNSQCSDQAQYNTTVYSLYYPDNTPNDYTDDVLADRWVVAPAPITGTLQGGGIAPTYAYSDTWVNFNDAPGAGYLLQPYNGYNQWRLNASPLFTDTHNNGRGNVGQNNYGLRVKTANANVLAYALDRLQSVQALAVSGSPQNQTYYLTNIPTDHAGQTAIFSVFDPGDINGPNCLQLLNPSGTPVTFHVVTHGIHNPDQFDTACLDTDRQVPDHNYNDEWLDLVYTLPSNYVGGYWKMRYNYGPGGGNDRTSWRVVVGDVPYITPTPTNTGTATPIIGTNTPTPATPLPTATATLAPPTTTATPPAPTATLTQSAPTATATGSLPTITPPLPTITLPLPTLTPPATDTPPPNATATMTGTPLAATPTTCPNPFVDISNNTFYNAIMYLYCRGIVNGVDSTHYGPGGTASRAQFAKVVVLGFNIASYTPATPDFTDVPITYYAYSYIEAGFHAGILSGFDAQTCQNIGAQFPCYGPNRPITRAQLTKLVVNAAGYTPYTPTMPTFSDVQPNNVFYVSIETAHYKGVINGYPNNTFLPDNPIRRDEMAQIVYKAITTP